MTAERPARLGVAAVPRRRTVAAGLAALGGALAAAACGVPNDDDARFEDDAAVPYGLLDPTSAAPPAAAAAGTGSPICLVDDDRLRAVERSLPPTATPGDALAALVAGPSREELSLGLSTAVPDGAFDDDPEAAGGIVEVELGEPVAEIDGRRQLLAVAQVVCTLTARPGLGQVAFTLDGERIDVPRGDGTTTSGPVARDDYAELLPAGSG